MISPEGFFMGAYLLRLLSRTGFLNMILVEETSDKQIVRKVFVNGCDILDLT